MSLHVGVGVYLGGNYAGGVGADVFTPLSLSPIAWYDPSDITTLFQDSAGTTPVTATGDPVGRINDKSGNGYHATQGTDAARPLYTVAGGYKYLLFDGVDDFLRATFAISQPFDRISAAHAPSITAFTQPYGGATGNAGAVYFTGGSGAPLEIYDGTTGGASRAFSAATDYVITERHDNANSRMALDNGTYGAGATGSSLGGGVTVAASNGSTSNVQMKLHGMAMFAAALSDANIALMRTYLAAKQGRIL